MYNKQFVLAVLNNGSPVREIEGRITLPFGSEYKIRLKNKNNVRAKARVWIDGRQVSGLGDFILHAGETLDLERFLDASMSEGNRFKFVPLSDKRVNDPTDSENGIVKVEFYLEEVFKIDYNIPTYPIKPLPHYPKASSPWGYLNDNTTAGSPNLRRGSSSQTFTSLVSNSIDCNYVSDTGQAGATVEGGHSNQAFTVGNNFQTSVFPVTLTLKIQGPQDYTTSSPKLNPRFGPKYCTGCGASRKRRSDKFCGNCGTKFTTRRKS